MNVRSFFGPERTRVNLKQNPLPKFWLPIANCLLSEAPARVDGGDILRVGKQIYIGLSSRSDTNAIEQIQDFLQPYGYEVHAAMVSGCLHLKSAVTQVANDTLLINPAWTDKKNFAGMKFIEIDPSEPYAANALWIGDTILYPKAFPKTRKKLADAGIKIVDVDADELAKAEGALTCCSLISELITKFYASKTYDNFRNYC